MKMTVPNQQLHVYCQAGIPQESQHNMALESQFKRPHSAKAQTKWAGGITCQESLDDAHVTARNRSRTTDDAESTSTPAHLQLYTTFTVTAIAGVNYCSFKRARPWSLSRRHARRISKRLTICILGITYDAMIG